MNEPVRNLEIQPTVSVDGLDDLFQKTPSSEQGDEQGTLLKIAQGDEQGVQPTICNPDHWTLQFAAETLKLSIATIRRRLSKRELSGYKVDGINGPEWRIIPPAQNTNTEQGHPAQSVEHPMHLIEHPAQPVITALLDRLSDVESQLTQSQKDLQAANWRNGYLESQLENEREQIKQLKLLTDSQHKTGWWSRFYSWFIGR